MKYFTKAQIEEIRKQLATLGVRDTDLPDASTLTGNELVAIVQDGENRVVRAIDLFGENVPPEIFENIKQGKSAYDLWLEAGNTGSLADFLASLKGANGRDGVDGRDGQDGTSGSAGAAAGFGTPTASVDTTASGEIGVSVSASGPNTAKVFDFTFHNLGNGGGGPGGDDGEAGRSVTGIDLWFKLHTSSTSVTAPALSIVDPSSAIGGSWSLQSSNPTEQLPYLWCFLQTNYDKPLANGYTYSRSSAYIARRYNSDSSAEYSELETMITNLRTELLADMAGYESDLRTLNTALNSLRSTIEGQIASDLAALNSRLSAVEGTDVKKISSDGLWRVLTTYYAASGTNAQKALAAILLDAVNAKATLTAGSTFFDRTVGTGLTLDGLNGRIDAKASMQDVNNAVASATFSVDPGALSSVISKAQCGWEKDGVLYQYDLYLVDYRTANPSSTLADYDTYMQTAAGSGGPAGDATRPAGPFTPIVVVNEFSTIKQTVDSISASVDTFRYMWVNGNTAYPYDYFETDYDERTSTYELYTYDQYVHDVLGYTKTAVSDVLSNINQTAATIRATVGEIGYFWYKQGTGGTYEYEAFAIPDGTTRSAYISSMEALGWTLFDYASKFSVIDQTSDQIELAVKRSRLVWINPLLAGNNANYCLPYDNWYTTYQSSGFSGTYEQYVSAYYSSYQLQSIDEAISRIKQTESSISSAVANIGTMETRLSSVEQTADKIKIGVGVVYKTWFNSTTGDIKAYDYWYSDWENASTQLSYENWVPGAHPGYALSTTDVATELAGLLIESDKIWACVGDGHGNVAAAISILGGLTVQDGKIILDASKVEATNTFAAHKLVSSLTNGSRVEIEAGFICIYDSNNKLRIRIGQATNESVPVLKFYDTDGITELYDLGPNGFLWNTRGYAFDDCSLGERQVLGKLCNLSATTISGVNTNSPGADVRNAYRVFYPATKSKLGEATLYYNYNEKQGDGVSGHGWVSALTIEPYNGILVKVDDTYTLRPNGANAEMEVWPKTSASLLTVAPADGWYLDNTSGFASNYRGTITIVTPDDPGEEA